MPAIMETLSDNTCNLVIISKLVSYIRMFLSILIMQVTLPLCGRMRLSQSIYIVPLVCWLIMNTICELTSMPLQIIKVNIYNDKMKTIESIY